MNSDIYEVLDRASGGIRLQVEFQPRVNYSLISSGIPFIRAIVVHNETGAELGDLELTATLAMGTSATWRHVLQGPMAADSVVRIDEPSNFAVFSPLLAQVAEASPAVLELRVTNGPEIVAALEVSAVNEFLNFPGKWGALAAFVQPNAPAVTPILRAASDLLLRKTRDGSLAGYQGGPERAEQIAGAIYESLRGLEVTYINPPASFERTGQKVRTTTQVLGERFGTCIDLAVLYAACLEAAGLHPVIFLTVNHAFAGFHRTEAVSNASVIDAPNVLTNLVEIGQIRAVELTGIGPGANSLSFRKAAQAATEYFVNSFDLVRSMVDVRRARIDGVRPMALYGGEATTPEQVLAERPFVASSSLRGLSIANADEEVVIGLLDHQDDSPARFKQWKRDVLDLSLRNPLLNMPRNSRVLDLVVPAGKLSKVDDTVHSGTSIRLMSGIDTSELAGLTDRVVNQAASEVLWAQFTLKNTLYSLEPDAKHRARLRAMKRDAETLEQETGSNYLYLTIGTLVHEKPSGGEARAPLFLLPVKLKGGVAFSPYSFSLEGDDIAQPNLCLLEWLKATKGLDLTELSNPALDDSGLAISTIFSGIRKRLVDAELPYRLDETVSLAILKFSTFQIWKDLDENWRHLMTNPVVEHLVERPGETFTDAAASSAPHLDEQTLRLPIAADGSQMAAIVRATSGQSFVLEGPPGTGKSQTITNLIAHAVGAGKRVLFVAEKQAALEVVKRRLDAVGLGVFCLELHGDKQSMRSIRDQLKTALAQKSSPDTNQWASADTRFRAAVSTLERYPALLHEKNPAGHSLWSAYDAVAVLGDGPAATIPTDRLAASIPVTDLIRDYAATASRFGARAGHPWAIVGPRDAASLDAATMTSALAELRAIRARLPELSPQWTAALREARPLQSLRAILLLIAAAGRQQLPTVGHVPYIDRPSWGEAIESARAALARYRSDHARMLEAATPEAWSATDLAAIETKSAQLDSSAFFREFRRRKLVERVRTLVTLPFESSGLTTIVRELRAAIAAAVPVVDVVRGIQGLLLDPQWQPFAASAQAQLDEATLVARTAVWANASAPAAFSAIGVATAADVSVLRDIEAGFARWASAVGATDASMAYWAGADWVAAWAASEPIWQQDVAQTGALQAQRFTEVAKLLEAIRAAGLVEFAAQLGHVVIQPGDAPEALLRGIALASVSERLATTGLASFDADAQDRAALSYLDTAGTLRELLKKIGPAEVIGQRPFRADNLRGEVAELARQMERKRGGMSFRDITKKYPDALRSIVPVFLMSPGSVAHYLDPNLSFDLVIFDEASQVRVPQAIGSMGRGKAVIVVGDSRQMPPTRVMQVDASADLESTEEIVVEDLESILSEAAESGLPRVWLEWHYRSQDESLIAFSNSRYYESRLVSLPSPGDDPHEGVAWRRVDGVFDRGRSRTNEVEARAIVDEIVSRLRNPATRGDSIGVVCFNIQQRDLILNLLEDSSDLLVQRALALPPGEALFVKNLENVQGDERDSILFSLAFSVDAATGVLPLNFGPLNLVGGERRLNVAITRARKNIVLFSSFDPADIDLKRSSSQGIADLKAYLEFASDRVALSTVEADATMSNSGRFVEELSEAIRGRGYEVERDLGMSAFKVDVAVRKPGEERWRLAIMVDGPGWSSRPTVADRDGSPALLSALMGWSAVTRVWLPGWIRDKAGTLQRIVDLMERPLVEPTEPEPAPIVNAPAPIQIAVGPVSDPVPLPSAATVEPFVPAPTSVIASQSVLNNMVMAVPAVERISAGILDVEGPTLLPRLLTIVAKRFGYSRIGDAKKGELSRVVEAKFVVIDGFVWPPSLDPTTWEGIRRTVSTEDRAITEVSPRELGNAMEHVLRESFSMSRDDLLRETADLLGYKRLTVSATAWLSKALDAAIRDGRVTDDGTRLRAV